MSGIISRITDVINAEMPIDRSAFTRYLGTAIPLDPFMTGKTRFATKIGEIMPVMLADCATSLARDALIQEREIVTNEILQSITIRSKLLLDSYELVTVEDFTTDPETNRMTIRIRERLRATHFLGGKVLLFGHPVTVTAINQAEFTEEFSTFSTDATGAVTGVPGRKYVTLTHVPMTVISVQNMTSGQRVTFTSPIGTKIIAFPTPPTYSVRVFYDIQQTMVLRTNVKLYKQDVLALNFSEYPFESVQLASQTSDAYAYQVTLANGLRLPPEAPAGATNPDAYRPSIDSTVHIRAFAVYESEIVSVPTFPTTQAMLGPVVVDWLSGTTVETDPVEEFASIELYDAALELLSTQDCTKDTPLWQFPIRSDAFLFFDVLRGSVNWNGSETLMYPDNNLTLPVCQLHYQCVPVAQVNPPITQWAFTVNNPNTTTVRVAVQFDPAAPQSFDVPAQSKKLIIVVAPTEPIERIFLSAFPVTSAGDPGGLMPLPIGIGSWYTDAVSVGHLRYTLFAKATARFTFGVSTMLAKPIFLNTEYLKTFIDFNALMDNARLVL